MWIGAREGSVHRSALRRAKKQLEMNYGMPRVLASQEQAAE
jgi:hypothetical protein